MSTDIMRAIIDHWRREMSLPLSYNIALDIWANIWLELHKEALVCWYVYVWWG